MSSSFSFLHGQNARARKSPSFQLRWLLLGVATATPLGCAGELGARGRHRRTALCAPGWCCRGDHLWRSRKVRDRDATLAVHRPRLVAEQIDLLQHAPWCDGQISSYRSRQGWITRLHIVQACAIDHHATPGDGRFCVELCIETLYKRATSVAHLTNFLFEFLWNFRRRCLFTSPIPCCKKVKNDKSTDGGGGGGGSCLTLFFMNTSTKRPIYWPQNGVEKQFKGSSSRKSVFVYQPTLSK